MKENIQPVRSIVSVRKRLRQFAGLVKDHDAVLVFHTQGIPKSDLVTAFTGLSDGIVGLHLIEPMGRTSEQGFIVTYGWISPSLLRKQALGRRK